ncbi:MAG: hypothetical protein HC822_18690 [Oscillochloris sp.]|nr:hypothetical protein [Oscillochloris sp.]
MQILIIIMFGLAWWFGLYLLARDPAKPLLQRVGGGLLLYALALAAGDIGAANADPRLSTAVVFLALTPAIAWVGALPLFFPIEMALRDRLDRLWQRAVWPLSLLVLLALVADLMVVAVALVLLPLLFGLALVIRRRSDQPSPKVAWLLPAATIFFIIGVMGLAVPPFSLARQWVLLAVGVDLGLLGLAAGLLDAFEEGETLRRDLRRSFVGALVAATIFGGQIAAALALGAGLRAPAAALLYTTLAGAIAVVVLAAPFNTALDRLSFPGARRLQRERAELRALEEALPRRDDLSPLLEMDEATFAKITRRALSHYGDLPRLASSPLIELPIIAQRLQARNSADRPLERAAELKSLLAECIARLKPRSDEDFGASDEWRHYNVLYFPYVVGLKPYSRRGNANNLDPLAQQALDWLAQVPERTLYNWQNAAARLIAADLRNETACGLKT